MSKKKGITIGEIMLGISIVFTLICVAWPFLISSSSGENVKTAASDIKNLQVAIAKMELDTKIPAGGNTKDVCLDDLEYPDISDCKLGLACNDGTYKDWKGPYIKPGQKDPWGNPYYIDSDYYVGSKIARVVGSRGPNGVQEYNGGDDIIQIVCLNRKVDLEIENAEN